VAHIHVENVSKAYSGQTVLKNISLDLASGSQTALLGASGSGKSTLLYLLGGLDRVDAGKIQVDRLQVHQAQDQELATYRNRDVGFIFQFHFLLPSMNCLDNILLPCEIGGFDKNKIKARVIQLADQLGVTQCLKKFPYQLSGGEQQMLAVARALMSRPKLLLMDEPSVGLAPKVVAEIFNIIRQLHAEGVSIFLVEQNANMAARVAQHFYLLEQGRQVFSGDAAAMAADDVIQRVYLGKRQAA